MIVRAEGVAQNCSALGSKLVVAARERHSGYQNGKLVLGGTLRADNFF